MVKLCKASAAVGLGACVMTGLLAFTARAGAIAQNHAVQHLAAQDNTAHTEDAHWGYGGVEGPEFWGQPGQDYDTCATGTQQSPIDLRETVNANLDTLQFDYWKPASRPNFPTCRLIRTTAQITVSFIDGKDAFLEKQNPMNPFSQGKKTS